MTVIKLREVYSKDYYAYFSIFPYIYYY